MFAEGVNLYIDELKQNGKWPAEFTLLGYKPEPWTPVDSLTIGKYMAFDLGGNWEDQAFRQYLLQTFPKEKAYDLFPDYPKGAPYIISKEELDIEKVLQGLLFLMNSTAAITGSFQARKRIPVSRYWRMIPIWD